MNLRTMALAGLLAALPLANAFAATTWIVTGTGEPATINSAACNGTSFLCPTLRDAINSAGADDTIRFSNTIDGGTIVLSWFSNDLGATKTSSEFGPSAFFFTGGMSLTIDGETGLTRGITIARDSTKAPFRLFDIDTGSNSLTLQGLTLKNGLAQGFSSDFGGGALGAGGAIFNQGTLTIDSCTFVGNAAQGGASGDGSGNYSGAGVGSAPSGVNGGGPNGSTAVLVDGGFGGGGYAYSQGSNGGFGGGGGDGGNGGSGGFGGGAGGITGGPGSSANGGFGGGGNNGTRNGGGGAGMGGAIFNDAGTLTIVNSTFTNNSASGAVGGSGAAGGAGLGGAIFNYSAVLNIQSSTLARNSVTGVGGGIADGGAVYSLDDRNCATGGNTCGITVQFDLENSIFSNSQVGVHDIVINGHSQSGLDTFSGLIVMSYDNTQFTISNYASTADPQLSPLGHHGGWTPTMVPHAGSAAIDKVACVLTVDQRGVQRPYGSNCDVGAVEYDGDYIFANGFD